MKKAAKQSVATMLKAMMQVGMRRARPEIVGVTGSVGKTTTKDVILQVLKRSFRVTDSVDGYNTEIGVPLAFFAEEIPYPLASPLGWIKIFIRILRKLIRKGALGTKVVLEIGADEPEGIITYITSFVPLKVAVVTAIAPAHTQYFKDLEAIYKEKVKVVRAVSADGLVVLNADDPKVRRMQKETKAEVVLYGTAPRAHVRAEDIAVSLKGVSFTLTVGRDRLKVRSKLLGRHLVYPLLAAAAVGLYFGMELSEIADAFETLESPKGRLRPIPAIRGAMILDDSYNASPKAMLAGLDAVAELPAKRRILALGTMNELGEYEEEGHRLVGQKAAEVGEMLVTVGESARRFLADEARAAGLSEERIRSFKTSDEAGEFLRGIVRDGDLVYVKGSQADVFMERLIVKIMKDPHRAAELLVRQSRHWRR